MGFQKVIWGSGDETHVIDVLTPMDYTDFVNQDYIDRKLAELMIKLNWKFLGGSVLETVYQPVVTPDTFPLEGPWVPYDLRRLLENDLDPSSDVIYPNTETLEYGQLAARWSKAPGRLDLGFDRNLGLSKVNLELQLRGNYVMQSGKILPGDTEYNARGKYTHDILILALRDSYFREKIRPVVSLAYTLEERDYLIWPEVDFTLRDDATITLMYLVYGGDPDTFFGQFSDNDFFEIRFEYRF